MARFELRAKLGLDGQQFFSTIHAAEVAGTSLAKSLKSHLARAFTVGALIGYADRILKLANHWEDVADQVHTSVESVQELEYAFKQAGLSGEDSVNAMFKLSRAVDEALGGGKTKSVFERIGISMGDLHSKAGDTAEVMLLLATAFEKMDRVTQRRFARDLFGEKTGEKFLSALENFRKGGAPLADTEEIKRVADASRTLSKLKSEISASAVNAAGRSISEVGGGWGSAARYVATGGVPGNFLAEAFRRWNDGRKGGGGLHAGLLSPFRAAAGATAGAIPITGVSGKGSAEEPKSFFDQDEFAKWLEALKRGKEIEEDIWAIQQKMLPVSQQRANIEAMIASKLSEARYLDAKGDQLGAIAATQAATDLAGNLLPLPTGRLEIPRNELNRIGGFRGGPVDSGLKSSADQQKVKLDQILREIQITNTILKNPSGGLE